MFRRLFALWSLVSLLLASGPAFAGGVTLSIAFTDEGVSQLVQTTDIAAIESDAQSDPAQVVSESVAATLVEVEPSLDPMDWPEGIELLGILSRASQLSHAIVPHTLSAVPSPCLASLQRPPCSRA